MINWEEKVLKPLMKSSVFGELVNYRPKSGAKAFDINGIYDSPWAKEFINLDDTAEINTTSPVIGVRRGEFINEPVQGDRLFIYSDNQLFYVSDVQPDSHGGLKLILNQVK